MKSSIKEVSEQIYRISIDIPANEIPVPGGFSFNQYLLVDESPTLFHTGSRPFFPFVKEQIEKVIPVSHLRYIGFSHYEQDECGAMNEFLQAAPQAAPLCGRIAAMTNGPGFDRAPKAMGEGETLNIGRKTLRWLDAAHLPHGWDCGYLFEEKTRSLFCGDLFTQPGAGLDALTEGDILGPSEAMRAGMDYFAHGPSSRPLLQKLANTQPALLACMHGSAWRGNGVKLLADLAALL